MKNTKVYTAILLAVMFIFTVVSANYVVAQSNKSLQTLNVAYIEPQNKTINLASPTNGGEVLAASNDSLATLINEKLVKQDIGYGEIVIGFKDNKVALIEKFTFYIPETDRYNVKDFELFVSNESPTSGFKSIGKFTTQNIKLFKTPYQEFTFAPVKARYLKWKPLLNFNNGSGGCYAYGFQVFGKLASSGQ